MNLWKSISSVGLRESDGPEFVRKVHLINRMAFCGAMVSLFFAIHVYSVGHYEYLYFQIPFSILIFGFFVFSKFRMYDYSLYWFYIFVFTKITYSSLEMKGSGVEYFFIPLGLVAFTVLDSIKRCYILLVLAVIGFFVSDYFRRSYQPRYFYPPDQAYYTFIVIMLTTFALCTVMVSQFRTVSRRYEALVESQYKLVSDKNQEITDSITYARHLQNAILPPVADLDEKLQDYFLIYKPKDIVAGDFYWMETKANLVFVAAADCTGHGIPGSIVSVVCYNALHRAVNEFGLTDTGLILDKSKEIVVETFGKSETEVKDGMDISLCAIDFKTRKVQWSGANNPLWFIQDHQFFEIPGDKQPVGKSSVLLPFRTYKLDFNPGDTLFLVTDGFEDQFGGIKGKKFKSRNLKELLFAQSKLPLNNAKFNIENEFNSWKGTLEQVDDVCIIGIRFV